MIASIYISAFLTISVLLCKGDNLDGYKEQKSIIVVGGGIAGLAAARTLHNTGLYNVNVLEARRERYGGRVFTDRKAMKFARGVEVDLGPNYLNSMIKDNPLANMAKDGELEVKSTGKVQLHYPDKNQVFTGDDANKVFTEFYKVTMSAFDKVSTGGKDVELKSAIKNSLKNATTINDKALLSSILASHFAMALPDHSTQQFLPKKEFGWDTTIVDGFDQIVDILVGGKERESVLAVELRKPVRQVAVDKKKKKVLVRTKDLKQFEADAVIVALPVGVMKTDTVMFDPPLPKQFKMALDSLGTGNTNKVILQFNKVFWPKDIGVFTMVTSKPEDIGIFQTWVNLQRYVNKPLLSGKLHDQAAIRFENMTDDEIIKKAIDVLTTLFGEEKLKDVTATVVARSKWMSDNKLLGTTTYPKVGIDPEVFKSLSEPLCPYIYFAGEYTILEHLNTAHGAYMSGVSAANHIINNYCEEQEKKKSEKKDKKKDETKEKSTNSSKAKNAEKEEIKDEL